MQLRVTPLRVTRCVAPGPSAGCRRPETAVAEGVWQALNSGARREAHLKRDTEQRLFRSHIRHTPLV